MVAADPLIDVSLLELCIAMTPLFFIAWGSWYLELDVESPILMGTFRSFLQLTVLSLILNPIFVWGVELWWVVVAYMFFMILLAAFESSSRIKYYIDHLFWYVLGAMLMNVAIVAAFAFGVIIRPNPVWDPQYVIPITGMLLGNCINGVSLSLNSMLTAMVESSREVELLLCFGANSYEASARLLREAVRTGAMPLLNGMAIIGIISIPGMMTGQILGGSSVKEAARYQILIMYLIAFCCLGTMFTQVYIALSVCFDSRMKLRTDRIFKKEVKPSMIDKVWSFFKHIRNNKSFEHGVQKKSDSFSSLIDEATCLTPQGVISVVSNEDFVRVNGDDNQVFVVNDLSYEFEGKESNDNGKIPLNGDARDIKPLVGRRVLFQNISFSMSEGSAVVIKGPSGVGKSTVLRVLAGLNQPREGSSILLMGKSQSSYRSVQAWRKQVLYVPQSKVDIPGTPAALLGKICSFRVWHHDENSRGPPPISRMKADIREIIKEWGMSSSLFTSEWKQLSGGESQRMLLALALVTRPKVIMLDESTSALDLDTKVKVEKTVAKHCREYGMCAIWISHDENQQDRVQMN